jgi:hypothetical protein
MRPASVFALCAALATAACAFPIQGREKFLVEAPGRTAEFPGNYQALYRCFTDKYELGDGVAVAFTPGFIPIFVPTTGPRAELYPDLRLGEFRLGSGESFFQLVTFQAVADDRTRVSAHAVTPADVETHWRNVLSCTSQSGAHLSPTHR